MPKFSDVPFAVQEGTAGVRQNSAETLRNMFAEITVSGRSKILRRQRAGLTSIQALVGEKRCIEKFNGVHYLIVADTLYSYDGVTLTTLGTLGTSVGRCSMVCNDNGEIMISDGAALSWWNGTTLALVTNTTGFIPGVLSYLNGYAIVNSVGTDQFFWSSPDDFSTIDPLDFATAESSPDALLATFVDHNEIWLIGTDTTEIWQDVGGTDSPFQAITSAKIERGTAAALSTAADDNTVINLGNDGVVYRYEGYRPLRISTHAIEEALRNCTSAGRASAYALIYTHGGHKFYTLTVPGELTVQYNFATQLWNDANTYLSPSWDIIGSNGHYADYVLTVNGIAKIDIDAAYDESVVVLPLARSAPGWASGNRITLRRLFVDCEVGRAAIGVTPQIMLRVALDGETFGNSLVRDLGQIGNYAQRPVFGPGLGQGRKPVLEIAGAGGYRLNIMGTLLSASVANS